MTVVVGVDGAGRTHRLREIAGRNAWWYPGTGGLGDGDGTPVVVDDAHRLADPELRALAAAAAGGTPMVMARRPTIGSPALAALDEILARDGVEVLVPLDHDGVARLVATVTGRPVSPATAATVLAASAGLPAIAAAIANGPDAPALLARVQRRFAVLAPGTAAVARVLALRVDGTDEEPALGDDVLAAAAGTGDLPAALRELRDEGLLTGERLVPAVADAVRGELSAAERRRVHDAVARAMIDTGADPLVTARRLRAARVRTPAAAAMYLRAGELTRLTAPATALTWFDDALDAGADPGSAAVGRAEAATLLGLPVDLDAADDRARLLAGAAAAHDGRADRAAATLLAAPAPGPLLAVPLLVGTGHLDRARAAARGSGPLARLADAAILAATDPDAAVPMFIEAAEDAERAPPDAVLPDTPHALGAVVAVAAGDLATAEHLLGRAGAAGVGGPAGAERHRLLLAWARLRAGRYDTALAELRRTTALPGRERLLRAALAAGIARRRGDIAGLHAVWDQVEPVLARRTVDLWQLEATEELLVAAVRLRHRRRVEPVLELLAGTPWRAALGWLLVQVAVAEGDADTVAAQAEAMPDGPGARAGAQRAAARLWAEVAAGRAVDPDTVHEVTRRLALAELPWEASRLAGQAAITTTDAAAARRMLERARELTEPDAAATPAATGLSERELDVARMVLAGSTHKEIGAQLYIAPKTVEHHVARIRTKLGAGSRAELLAMLRDIVPDPR